MGDNNQLFFLKRHAPRANGPVLEIGSKDYGSTADFRSSYREVPYTGLDLAAGNNVDVVQDLTEGIGALPPGHFDLAICCSVLEHVDRPWEFARNVTRLVRTGGRLYMSVPWVWRFHAYPDDYFRYSWRGIEALFPDFEWSHRYYSTNVEDEFIAIDEFPDADNRMALMQPVEGGQRKHLPYLMVNMIGTKRAAGDAVPRTSESPDADLRRVFGDKPVEQHIWDGYMAWFYHTNVWKQMRWHGVRTLKLPSDMWNYQEIIHERGVDWVIECGTRHGGSALFFADALAGRDAPGQVISIDIDAQARQVEQHPRIRFMLGDSGAPAMAREVMGMLPATRGTAFLILDSDHSKAHVLRELEAWVPLMRKGDYLVVEDTNVNGHPVRPDFGPGPWEAVEAFVSANPGLLIHDAARERKFGATAAPNGHFIRN